MKERCLNSFNRTEWHVVCKEMERKGKAERRRRCSNMYVRSSHAVYLLHSLHGGGDKWRRHGLKVESSWGKKAEVYAQRDDRVDASQDLVFNVFTVHISFRLTLMTIMLQTNSWESVDSNCFHGILLYFRLKKLMRDLRFIRSNFQNPW
jgi:hypothetical protein